MLLYIHVPFCRAKCRYCAFHSMPLHMALAEDSDALRSYVNTLCMEMDFWGHRLGRAAISSVFIGGGTPSLLPPAMLARLLEHAASTFRLDQGAEISMEANPESLTDPAHAAACLRTGVNRLSLGVQSLDDGLLRVLGRAHRAEDVLRAVHAAREAGCTNLNLDLMWALPGQDTRHWLATLDAVLRLRPEHISAYALTLEEGTPLLRDAAQGSLSLPDDDEQERMFLEGAALLERAGYMQYEISNFAQPGLACRHNQGYWEGRDYLGLGPAATSTLHSRRWTNPDSRQRWTDAVRAGRLADHAEHITPDIRLMEMIMLCLRTTAGLPLADFRQQAGFGFIEGHRSLIRTWQEHGLVMLRNGRFCLTQEGMLLSNSIISDIFERTEELLRRRKLRAQETSPHAEACRNAGL